MKVAIACLIATIASSVSSFTEEADSFFGEYVSDGRVDYQALKRDPSRIDQLYQQVGEMSLEDASDDEKKAFYINAYNIATIHQVVEHYPVKSPNDVKGFFDQKKQSIAGEPLTLNDLEKKKLLEPYQDPRIHFVLVCAAMSCPPLADFAYRANTLDEQLDDKTREALNNDDFIRVNDEEKKVELSKIFEWYQRDFTRQAKSPVAYINQYCERKIPEDYKVSYYSYDWTLNKQ